MITMATVCLVNTKVSLPYLSLYAITSTKFDFSGFKSLEAVRSKRCSRTDAITIATPWWVQIQSVFCITTHLKSSYIYTKVEIDCLNNVEVVRSTRFWQKLWLPWQCLCLVNMHTHKIRFSTSIPQCHNVNINLIKITSK